MSSTRRPASSASSRASTRSSEVEPRARHPACRPPRRAASRACRSASARAATASMRSGRGAGSGASSWCCRASPAARPAVRRGGRRGGARRGGRPLRRAARPRGAAPLRRTALASAAGGHPARRAVRARPDQGDRPQSAHDLEAGEHPQSLSAAGGHGGMARTGQANHCWASTPEAFAGRSSTTVVPFGSAPDTDAVSGPDRAARRTSATCQHRLRRDPLDHPACHGDVVRRRRRGRSTPARPQGDRRRPRLRARRLRARRHRAADHRRHRRVPRLAVGADPRSATAGASSPSRPGSRRPTSLGIGAVLVGTVSVAAVAMVFAFPLALLTALFISEYAPAGIKADADLAGRPDGRRALDHLRHVGLLPRHAPRGRVRPVAARRTSAGSRSSTSTPTRTPPSGTSRATSAARSARASPSR